MMSYCLGLEFAMGLGHEKNGEKKDLVIGMIEKCYRHLREKLQND